MRQFRRDQTGRSDARLCVAGSECRMAGTSWLPDVPQALAACLPGTRQKLLGVQGISPHRGCCPPETQRLWQVHPEAAECCTCGQVQASPEIAFVPQGCAHGQPARVWFWGLKQQIGACLAGLLLHVRWSVWLRSPSASSSSLVLWHQGLGL